jgi:hypothetical protein
MKNKLEPVESAVEKGFFLICEKCGKKLEKTSDENPSRHLQKFLKDKIKDELGKDQARAIMGSCQNICPSGKIVVSVLPVENSKTKAQSFLIDAPETSSDFESLWTELKKTI